MDKEQGKSKHLGQEYSENSRYLGLGITFALTILLCMAVGHWLDGKWDTKPIFFLVGTFWGAVAAFVKLYKVLVAEDGNNKKGKDN